MSANDTIVSDSPMPAPVSLPLASIFPAAKVAAVLQEEFVSAVVIEAELLDMVIPEESEKIARLPFDIDSLTAIEILLSVENIVGIELPSSVVKAGGYESIDNAIEKLLPNIEKQWKKHNGVAA